MKATTGYALLGALLAALPAKASPTTDKKRDVDTRYPYNGMSILAIACLLSLIP
jgi:hypothetical protein